ncbi:MAG: glycoside hydrolase family 172 protein [Fimbriimonadales bacterium]
MPFSELAYPRRGRTRRSSSWDRGGGNSDWVALAADEIAVIADTGGAGVIRHVWLTASHRDPLYLRKMVIRAFWDGESYPSVECPVGDFFCLGHGIAANFQNASFNAVCTPEIQGNLGGGVALNCYFPMPFSGGMRIEVENQSVQPCESLYFYIDYDEFEASDTDLRFHAQYRQEYPTTVDGGTLISRGKAYWSQMGVENLSGEGNYLVFEAQGSGHFVGCNLSVENIDIAMETGATTWWGEGDDMFWIDGDESPTLHGTGSEDYFTQAWGMHEQACLYGGTSIHEHNEAHPDRKACTGYRLHILDPIIFSKSIKFSFEHGHANLQQNDYSSVAYWYQAEPHVPFDPLPSADGRVPRFARNDL